MGEMQLWCATSTPSASRSRMTQRHCCSQAVFLEYLWKCQQWVSHCLLSPSCTLHRHGHIDKRGLVKPSHMKVCWTLILIQHLISLRSQIFGKLDWKFLTTSERASQESSCQVDGKNSKVGSFTGQGPQQNRKVLFTVNHKSYCRENAQRYVWHNHLQVATLIGEIRVCCQSQFRYFQGAFQGRKADTLYKLPVLEWRGNGHCQGKL